MDTIILIGMPNTGKTSVGRILAHDIDKRFIDTDEYINTITHLTPREIVVTKGEKAFLKIQQELLINMDMQNAVIATGGSVVYSGRLMEYLKKNGYIIYLNTQLEELRDRLTKERRIVGSNKICFEQLYKERHALYKKYAHKEIDCTGKLVQDIVEQIKEEVMDNE